MSRIERIAVRYIEYLCDQTRRLGPDIPIGDKGRITDGHIDVFEGEYNEQTDHSIKDGNFIGRLVVQVKGKKAPDSGRNIRNYSLNRDQLEAIKRIGGLVLFVCEIPRRNNKDPKPYFAELSPENVDYILREMGPKQKTKAVDILPFPVEPTEVYRYIRHLQEKQGRRNVVKPSGPIMENATGFTVSVPRDVEFTRPQVFGAAGSIALVEIIGPNEEKFVLDGILQLTPSSYDLNEIPNLTISCGDIEFRDPHRRTNLDGQTELYISPGISLIPSLDEGTSDLTVTSQPRLREFLKDLRFLKNLSNGEWVKFNDERVMQFAPNGDIFDEFLKPLPFAIDFSRLCEHFGVDTALVPVTGLSKSTIAALEKITLFLFYGGQFEQENFTPLRHLVEVGNKQLQFMWIFDKESSQWELTNFFDSRRSMHRAIPPNEKDSEPSAVYVTPFDFFDEAEIVKILNLVPESMVLAFERLRNHDGASLANNTVLKLLKAADLSVERRAEFLGMAQELNTWTIKEAPDEIFFRLNYLQIKYRLGTLDESDTLELMQMRIDARSGDHKNSRSLVALATAILLSDHSNAERMYQELDDETQKWFTLLPIYFLYQNRDKPYIVTAVEACSGWEKVRERILDERQHELNKLQQRKPSKLESY